MFPRSGSMWCVAAAAGVLGLAMVPVTQADIVLTGDEQITVNSSVGNVTLHDTSRAFIVSGGTVNDLLAYNSSTVNIFGGDVNNNLTAYHSSTVNMSDGTVAGFYLAPFNFSTVNMSGGTVINLWPHDFSIVNMSGGTVDGSLITNESSTINMSGGTVISQLVAHGSSIANVSGGTVNNEIAALESGIVNMSGGTVDAISLNVCDSSVVTFSGRNFSLGGGLTLAGERVLGTGVLGGEWMEGTPWSVNISRNDAEATIRLVPEPGTLAMLATGLVGLLAYAWRRRKRPA